MHHSVSTPQPPNAVFFPWWQLWFCCIVCFWSKLWLMVLNNTTRAPVRYQPWSLSSWQSHTDQQTWVDWRKRFNSLNEQCGRVQILFEHSFKFEQYSAGYNKQRVYLKTPQYSRKVYLRQEYHKVEGGKMCIARKDPLNLTARLRTDNSHLNIFFMTTWHHLLTQYI